MAAKSVGTRPNQDAKVVDGKLLSTMAGNVTVGKGAEKDKNRVPIRTAEAAP
jgi:hypothetical protein